MTFSAASNSEIDVRDHTKDLVNGDMLILPRNSSFEWRVKTNMFYTSYTWHAVENCGTLDTSVSICNLTISTAPFGGHVEVFGLPQNLATGALLQLPRHRTIYYRVRINEIVGQEIRHDVGDCTNTLDASKFICSLQIQAYVGRYMEIYGRTAYLIWPRNLDVPVNTTLNWRLREIPLVPPADFYTHHVGNCTAVLNTFDSVCSLTVTTPYNGAVIRQDTGFFAQYPSMDWHSMIKNAQMIYRAEANGHNGPYLSSGVNNCSAPLDTTHAFCQITVTGLPNSSSWVDVPPQLTNLRSGHKFVLPKNVEFNWTVHSSGVAVTKTSFSNGTTCTQLNVSALL
jgi:hypothetical protein